MIYSNFYYCDSELQIKTRGFSKAIPRGKTNLECDYVSAIRVINKHFIDRIGGFDTSFRCAEDKDIIFRLEEVGELYFIDQVLYLYRKNPASITHQTNTLSNREWFEIAKQKAHKRHRK